MVLSCSDRKIIRCGDRCHSQIERQPPLSCRSTLDIVKEVKTTQNSLHIPSNFQSNVIPQKVAHTIHIKSEWYHHGLSRTRRKRNYDNRPTFSRLQNNVVWKTFSARLIHPSRISIKRNFLQTKSLQAQQMTFFTENPLHFNPQKAPIERVNLLSSRSITFYNKNWAKKGILPHTKTRIIGNLQDYKLCKLKADVISILKASKANVREEKRGYCVNDIDSSALETVVPKQYNSKVIVVKGNFCGKGARMLWKKTHTALVEFPWLRTEKCQRKLPLEAIAEVL